MTIREKFCVFIVRLLFFFFLRDSKNLSVSSVVAIESGNRWLWKKILCVFYTASIMLFDSIGNWRLRLFSDREDARFHRFSG